jgi:hypothetical protein
MESVIRSVPIYQRNLYSNLREPKTSLFSQSIIYSIVTDTLDLLGLISPVVVLVKIFLQRRGFTNLTWKFNCHQNV